MKKLIIISLILGLFTICCNINENLVLPPDVRYINADGPIPQRTFLEQDWVDSVRMKFWYTSQGSEIMPYNWFTWLEQPDNEEYFRNSKHMEMLGYLPEKTSKYNPSGLPIGFAMTRAETADESFMGLTCAACHTNQLDYKGTKYLIDGAPALANFVLLFDRIVDALNVTQRDDAKFNRFAYRVLGGNYNKKTASKLRSDLLEAAIKAGQRQLVNSLPKDYPEDFTSYARTDAFGNIENAGAAFALNDLTNGNSPTAPVSYPFLWGTHQSDVVQWNASAPNIPRLVGPMVRNTGEVVGVFGGLEIKKANWIKRLFGKKHVYSSTVDFHGLGALEGYVKILRSPRWSQTNLPEIDQDLSREGAFLYGVHCSGCHQVIPHLDEDQFYNAVKTPLSEVGTDPMMAWNIENHSSRTLILEGTKADIVVGERFADTTRSLNISLNGVVGLVLKNPIKAIEAGLITNNVKASKTWQKNVSVHAAVLDSIIEVQHIHAKIQDDDPSDGKNLSGLVYKARPLNGIWATAPYLHNGSIPNIWALLQKPVDRPETFWVGDREFDPKHIGFNATEGKNMFMVRNDSGEIQDGNSNHGHLYGTQLTDDEKWAILEYMKSL